MSIFNLTAVGERALAFWMGERFVGCYSLHEHLLLGDSQELLPRTDVALPLWESPMHC